MNIESIFGLFRKSKQTETTPPKASKALPWVEVVKACYDKGQTFCYPVVTVIYTDDKTQRAVILEKPSATFTIAFETLHPFDEDELGYGTHDLPGYWLPNSAGMTSFFGTAESATNAIFAEPPFKLNKSVVWADATFRIDAENLCWINNDGTDDPNDFCLHGHAFAKIGEQVFDYDAAVSATGLYLLRTLTEDHKIHEGQAMLPCCGNSMFANDDLSCVDICGCPNGIDWSVFHEGGKIRLVTETGEETVVDMDDYRKAIYTFADKIDAFYQKCLPKNLADTDAITRDGYTAFWNEWRRRRQ